MKTIFLIILVALLNIQAFAQANAPKLMGIVMIGKTSKPILDLFIVDSTRKSEFTFDVHTIVLFTDDSTLGNIYSSFQNEKRYDSLTKYDYSFGTFLFGFILEKNERVEIVASRIQSIEFFKKIIDILSKSSHNEAMIIKAIDENLRRINY